MQPIPDDDEQDGASRVGEVLNDRWRLEERLGGGGMGEVYRAVHVTLGRTVAIKLLRPEHALNASSVRRVLREGQAASRVTHPNVVRIEDVGVDGRGSPFLVQEFLDGVDLDGFADTWRGVVPAQELLPLMIPALRALGALHDAGILHRDLKPGNVFLVREEAGWSPRLLDFGLAAIDEERSGHPRITGSSVTLGSPAYMSPEQFRDPRAVTPRSDLWSCGVMLYELLSGVLPFEGATVGAVAIAVATETPTPLGERVPSLPTPLAAAVMRCLEKEPSRRPASAGELVAACEEALATVASSGAAMTAPPVPAERAGLVVTRAPLRSTESDPELPRVEAPRRRTGAILVAGVVAVVAVVVVSVASPRSAPRPVVAPVTVVRPPRRAVPPLPVAPIAAVVPPAPAVVEVPPPARPAAARPGSHAHRSSDAGAVAAVAPPPAAPPPAAPVVVAPPPASVTPAVAPLGIGIETHYPESR